METVGFCLVGASLILLVIGVIWFVFSAFMENVLWGFGILIIPPLWLLFLILHSEKAIKPFLTILAACALFLIGDFLTEMVAP